VSFSLDKNPSLASTGDEFIGISAVVGPNILLVPFKLDAITVNFINEIQRVYGLSRSTIVRFLIRAGLKLALKQDPTIKEELEREALFWQMNQLYREAKRLRFVYYELHQKGNRFKSRYEQLSRSPNPLERSLGKRGLKLEESLVKLAEQYIGRDEEPGPEPKPSQEELDEIWVLQEVRNRWSNLKPEARQAHLRRVRLLVGHPNGQIRTLAKEVLRLDPG